MTYSFPEHLADQVVERWSTLAARHDTPPPLPRLGHVRHILSTAFFASLEREEKRDLRFLLCCAPDLDVLREGLGDSVPVVELVSPRPLSVESLVALAPAVSPDNAALLVRCPPESDDVGACEIAGILHIGSHLALARSGRSFYYRPPPYALLVEVCAAGEVHVYQGGLKVAALKAGRLHDQMAYSVLEFLPISGLLSAGLADLQPRVLAPEHEPARERSDFEWTALLNTILCIVNGIRGHRHGGTLILTAPRGARVLPIRTKFEVVEHGSVLGDRFVEFLNARHLFTEAQWQARGRGATREAEIAIAHLQSAVFQAEEDLADAADVAAGFSAVDGALVLTSDLRVVGFGAEIMMDAAQPIVAYDVSGSPRAGEWTTVDGESFGMRHRSALRCVGVAEETAAFVASQDGMVSFFWKQDGRVCLKRHVNTANPNMVTG
jgi:hypothetical protein